MYANFKGGPSQDLSPTQQNTTGINVHNPILELSETAPRFTKSYIYTSIRGALSSFKVARHRTVKKCQFDEN